jgi:hypothetical protein
MIRVFNDHLGRALHATLYTRLAQFCAQVTPEVPYEPVVTAWLTRLYTSDFNLHILVALDDQYNITDHAVIDVTHTMNTTIIYCYQVSKDTADLHTLDDVMAYLDRLKEEHHAHCIVLNMSKHARAMEKRYDYTIARTTLIKYDMREDSEDSEDSFDLSILTENTISQREE